MKVTPQKAAKELGVTTDALRRWADEGRITVERTPGGHRRYDMDQLIAIAGSPHASEMSVITAGSEEDLESGLIAIGTREGKTIAIQNSVLDEHLLFCGKTGAGKSELMKRLILGVAKDNYPLVLIDPHGSLSDDVTNTLINSLPSEDHKRIVMCDFSDPDSSLSFNPLDIQEAGQVEGVVGSVLAMLERQMNFDKFSSPRAANYTYLALTALCEANLHLKDPETKCTLLHVNQFFMDYSFRQLIVSLSDHPYVKEMFDPDTGPFEQKQEKHQQEEIMPIIRTFQEFSRSGVFSSVFSNSTNKLDFKDLISKNKIIIIKLSRFHTQQRFGELVGSLILPYLLNSMGEWGKHRDPESGELEGKGCRIFIDEAPRLFGPDTPVREIMAEARKWDVGFVLSAQHLQSHDEALVDSLLESVSSLLSFVVEAKDARTLSLVLQISAEELVDQPRFKALGRILVAEGPHRKRSSALNLSMLMPVGCNLTEEGQEQKRKVIGYSQFLLGATGEKKDLADLKANLALLHADTIADSYSYLLEEGNENWLFEEVRPVTVTLPLSAPNFRQEEANALESLTQWKRVTGKSFDRALVWACEEMIRINASSLMTPRFLEAFKTFNRSADKEILWAVAKEYPEIAGLIGRAITEAKGGH
jgi:excisionase family DNA binding protein